MRTWKIKDGDIATDVSGRIDMVSGSDKIIQDVRHLLLNDTGFNRFHTDLGSNLDNFVGQIIQPRLLAEIRASVTSVLNTYMNYQMADIRKRVEERGEPLIAIGLAEPSGLVREWIKVDIREMAGSINILIGFRTFTDDYAEVVLAISNQFQSRL